MKHDLIKAQSQGTFTPKALEQEQLTEKELDIFRNIKTGLAIAFALCLIGCAVDLLA